MVNSPWFFNPATHTRTITIPDLGVDSNYLNLAAHQAGLAIDSGRLKYDSNTLSDVFTKNNYDKMVLTFQMIGAHFTNMRINLDDSTDPYKFDLYITITENETSEIVSKCILQGCLIVDIFMSSEMSSEQVKYDATLIYDKIILDDAGYGLDDHS